ncbi:MAG: hypothetical protein AB8G96_01785 [Phycisphaerales bacterium]
MVRDEWESRPLPLGTLLAERSNPRPNRRRVLLARARDLFKRYPDLGRIMITFGRTGLDRKLPYGPAKRGDHPLLVGGKLRSECRIEVDGHGVALGVAQTDNAFQQGEYLVGMSIRTGESQHSRDADGQTSITLDRILIAKVRGSRSNSNRTSPDHDGKPVELL